MSSEAIIMTWTEKSKNSAKWLKKRGVVKVYRGAFGKYNTRGAIAKEIHGDAGAEVTRKDMEDRFGKRIDNNFTETDKNSSNPSEVNKESSDWKEI